MQTFPFSSATKRMGIIVRDTAGIITFFMKGFRDLALQYHLFVSGADIVMQNIVKEENSEWMPEETENMAREGLRTLVFGYRILPPELYEDFARRWMLVTKVV